ncbi:DUF485 domain-containing protein [Aquibacillus koreensis]|uniref:DUF485 domain-containing protein n=1 Tax=Aquibacillus koreensis TaxID=279446 RepID=A0A9X3WPS3_9BACI|nr:DUF485 domain-containing protein [Aquibacillus koreensis]MCT2537839.1 DUF485 domain-containing protein [Aquibacillus koreensis]MDC3421129.1 DUF485 domain-containing protein [Aquibacillus koreensis]
MLEAKDSISKEVSLLEEKAFHQIIQEKHRFIIWTTIGFLIIYLLLPLFITYFQYELSLILGNFYLVFVWVYAFSLFLITWLLGWIYWKRANKTDDSIKNLINRKKES